MALALLAICPGIAPAATTLLPDTGSSPGSTGSAPAAGSIETERAADEDARIATRLGDIFANVPSLADVTVAVREGVVSLGGTVPDAAAADRAEAIAVGVAGVVTVENAIRRDVSMDVGEQVGSLRDLVRDIVRLLPLLAVAVITALLIAAFGYFAASWTALWRRLAPNVFLAELIASALRFVFAILGVVIALDMIGAGTLMGAVLGGAGVIGIALGFAMRDTVENYVSSLMLSLRQPFRANDLVKIDQHEGRVVRLTSRATILMTLDGNHLRIPNAQVFRAVILNYTTNPQRRFDFALGVDADDDPEAARVLGRQTLAGLPFVLAEPAPEAAIEEAGDSSMVLRFYGWIDQREADWLKVRSRAIAAVKTALEEGGFGLPEPIYRLRFDPRSTPLQIRSSGAAPGGAGPRRPRSAATLPDPDLAPDDEIARMVEEERAGTPGAADLLDPARPTE